MNNYKAVILLSGGLDSLVSLAYAKDKGCNIKLALTFDYGQRAADDEISAAKEICRVYGVEHKVIKLPFLGEISSSALNKKEDNLEFATLGENSMKAVWVPNRNGLFLNIAAAYCDARGYNCVIFGANKEEAETFSDNSAEFTRKIEECFGYSTLKGVKVIAPLAELVKEEIINLAADLNVDLRLLKSCYNSGDGFKNGAFSHCGVCESCKRLKNAILKSRHKDLIKLFF